MRRADHPLDMTGPRATPGAAARRRSPGRAARRAALLALLLACALAATPGCQEKEARRVSLTQEQWKQVRDQITETRPEPDHPVGATFGLDGQPLIELVGYDIEPAPLVNNKTFTLTWYWRALAPLDRDWKAFVHLTPRGGRFENLDHHPVKNMLRTSNWQPQSYVIDAQRETLRADFPTGSAELGVGWFDERTGERMTLLSVGQGAEVEPGKLRAGTIDANNDRHLLLNHVDQAPVLDGEVDDDPVWQRAKRTGPFGQATDGAPFGLASTVQGVYTDDSVYFAFKVQDRDLRATDTARDDKLWEQDCVEIYLNPDNDAGTYWELQISPGEGVEGQAPIFDAYFESHRTPHWEIARRATLEGMEAVVSRSGDLNAPPGQANDREYTVEVRIPFAGIQKAEGSLNPIKLERVPPTPGTTWRANFFRVDLNQAGARRGTRMAAWSTSGGDFHNLGAFGVLEFGPHIDVNAPHATSTTVMGEMSLRAVLISRGARVPNAPARELLDQERAAFEDCLSGLEWPEGEVARGVFKVLFGEDGEVVRLERPNPVFMNTAVTACIAGLIERWKLEGLAPIEQLPEALRGESVPPERVRGVSLSFSYAPTGGPRRPPGRRGVAPGPTPLPGAPGQPGQPAEAPGQPAEPPAEAPGQPAEPPAEQPAQPGQATEAPEPPTEAPAELNAAPAPAEAPAPPAPPAQP